MQLAIKIVLNFQKKISKFLFGSDFILRIEEIFRIFKLKFYNFEKHLEKLKTWIFKFCF